MIHSDHTDNTTANAAFASGTTRSTESMDLLRDAAVLAAAANIKLYARRVVPSVDNGLADALSRLDCVEWNNGGVQRMMMMLASYEKGQLWGWRPKSTRSRDLG